MIPKAPMKLLWCRRFLRTLLILPISLGLALPPLAWADLTTLRVQPPTETAAHVGLEDALSSRAGAEEVSEAQVKAINAIASKAQGAGLDDLAGKIRGLVDRNPSIRERLILDLFMHGGGVDIRYRGEKPELPYTIDAMMIVLADDPSVPVQRRAAQSLRLIIRNPEGTTSISLEQQLAIAGAFAQSLKHADPYVAGYAEAGLPHLLTDQKYVAALLAAVDQQMAQHHARLKNPVVEYLDPIEIPKVLGELDPILRDGNELGHLLAFLSFLRKHVGFRLTVRASRLPLESRLFFVPYRGLKLYLTSESFRRAIVGIPTPSGEEHFVELKFPGEEENRDLITAEHFTIAKALWKPGAPVVQPLAMVTAQGTVPLYDQLKDFTDPELPLRVVIFDYEDGSRLRNLMLDEERFAAMAEVLDLGTEELRSCVLDQLIGIALWVLREGFVGHREGMSDWHLENFRLLPDGRLILAGDLGAFQRVKRPLTRGELSQEVNVLIRQIQKFPAWQESTSPLAVVAYQMQREYQQPEQIWTHAGVPIKKFQVLDTGTLEGFLASIGLHDLRHVTIFLEDREVARDAIATTKVEFGQTVEIVPRASSTAGLEERGVAIMHDLAVAAWQEIAEAVPGSVSQQVLVFTKPETFDLVPLAIRWGWAVAVNADGPEADALRTLLDALRAQGVVREENYAIGTLATRQFLQRHAEQIPITLETRADWLARLGLRPDDLPPPIATAVTYTRSYLDLAA